MAARLVLVKPARVLPLDASRPMIAAAPAILPQSEDPSI
jgi:hypothetical protein